MYFSPLKSERLTRQTVSRFLGLDRRERSETGSFSRMENCCSEGYPALQVRPRRGCVAQLSEPAALGGGQNPVWVDGRTLYVSGSAVGAVLSEGEKQLLTMGAYLLVFPDKLWVNLTDLSDFGSMENTTVTSSTVTARPCRADGTPYEDYTAAVSAPTATNGALWMDTSGDVPVLRRCSDGVWEAVEEVCVSLSSPGIGIGFSAGDGVELSGIDALAGEAVLLLAEDDRVVIGGILPGTATFTAAVTLRRALPEMDYVVECGNRLWGCKYGMVSGRAVNEIYASKLGDFRNWSCYEGLSTDSYAASRGSDGPFTGAAVHLDSPLFFKEQCIERVYPSATGAHQIVTLHCPGVQQGSHKSPAAVDGTLYYHGPGGVYAFDGSLPRPVSAALNDAPLEDAVAGGYGGKYYLSAREGEEYRLLVYDSRLGLWHAEDGLAVLDFACCRGNLWALAQDGRLWDLTGSEGEAEGDPSFLAESGELGLDTAHSKAPRRITLQLRLQQGHPAEVFLSGDGGENWQRAGEVTGSGKLQRITLHPGPLRSPSLRLRLQGQGACTLYSVSVLYGKGSEER